MFGELAVCYLGNFVHICDLLPRIFVVIVWCTFSSFNRHSRYSCTIMCISAIYYLGFLSLSFGALSVRSIPTPVILVPLCRFIFYDNIIVCWYTCLYYPNKLEVHQTLYSLMPECNVFPFSAWVQCRHSSMSLAAIIIWCTFSSFACIPTCRICCHPIWL